jgi:2-oxoglutarate ferredoxin oxidoreductase subunit alpha
MASAEQHRLTWLIGGAQGSGVDSAANIFARACAFGSLHVYGQREYYSNIMGEHSYYHISVADRPVRASRDYADILVTFDAETVFLHAQNVLAGGGLIYDPKLAETPLERVQAMEERARHSLTHYLTSEKGLDATLGSMVRDAEARGVRCFPIPYDQLLQQLANETGTPLSALKRVINTLAVASSCAILRYEKELLRRAVEAIFVGKPKVIELNARACELAYQYVNNSFAEDVFRRLEPADTKDERIYLTGNEAVALGKIAAGCSVQTYYPISPATDESTYLDAHSIFPQRAGQGKQKQQAAILVLQTEDEIAAITSATGAALAGARASTSTSGPGFSLMVEGLGWAGINEVPLVVTLYQRGSPSTGLPTRSEQGDLRFALHAGHGEFPRLIIASGDLEECFYDAVRAFNWAERYQTPVIHLLDKALASSSQTLPPFDLERVRIDRGQLLTALQSEDISSVGEYQRFAYSPPGISPRTALGMTGGIFWNTGDEHDEAGHITEDPVVREQMMEKRTQKLVTAAQEIPSEEKFNLFGDPDAEAMIVSWGSPKGAILEAMERLTEDGLAVSFLQARLLWPLPAEALTKALGRARRRIAVETNYSGQFAGLIREQTGITMDHLIVKYNGRPISTDELYEALKGLLSGRRKALPQKVVLRHGI